MKRTVLKMDKKCIGALVIPTDTDRPIPAACICPGCSALVQTQFVGIPGDTTVKCPQCRMDFTVQACAEISVKSLCDDEERVADYE